MAEADTFSSSDSVRSGRELQYAQYATFDGPFRLECGGVLPSVTVAYETYGQLNEQRDNAVLVCHAVSGDSHVAKHDEQDDVGWWDIVVGPGKAIDTDRFFVICCNVLGGCRGTTGPNSINPATGQPYGPDFPLITIGDIAKSQRRLIEHLGIDQLLAVVGGSLGGQMALTWARRYSQRVRGIAAIATSPRLTSQALAFDVVGRNAILQDPNYQGGRYYDNGQGPVVGLAIARMLGHITYLSRESMMEKFDADRLQPRQVATQFETRFSVGSYLAYQGDRFGERFDPNSYITLSMAMDLFDVGGTQEKLRRSLGGADCRWLVVSFSSDWLFPPFQSQEIVDALMACNRPVSYVNVISPCGHDGFLLPNELSSYGRMLGGFLNNLAESPSPDPILPDAPVDAPRPTSIFHDLGRLDYESLASLIPTGASVLDLGCGKGDFLDLLREHGHRQLMGIELDEKSVVRCVRRGLDVVQADLNHGLSALADAQFDVVVLSQTLQSVIDVQRVVSELLRVGKQAIVSFPNLGYRKLRRQLSEEGRAPHVALGGGTRWYDTPNVRFLTIDDFEEFCEEHEIRIHKRIAINTELGQVVEDDPNLNADLAIAVLSR